MFSEGMGIGEAMGQECYIDEKNYKGGKDR